MTSGLIPVNPPISEFLISREFWSLGRSSPSVLVSHRRVAVYRAEDEPAFDAACLPQFLPYGPSNALKMLL